MRLAADLTMKTFSISLKDWIGELLKPQYRTPQDGDQAKQRGASVASQDGDPPIQVETNFTSHDEDPLTKVEVNFIQIFRNYMRFRGYESLLYSETMLSRLYQVGCALYAPPNNKAFDIFAPIRIIDSSKDTHFVPLLISCKARQNFSVSECKTATESMVNALVAAKAKKAVTLLVVTGCCSNSNEDFVKSVGNTNTTYQAQPELLSGFESEDRFVSLVVVIPEDDPFGINDHLVDTTVGQPVGEVIASHDMIREAARMCLGSVDKEALSASLLHAKSKKESTEKTLALATLDAFKRTPEAVVASSSDHLNPI